MGLIATVGTGIAIVVLGALLTYAFRVRQLYLLVPKMFGYSALTQKGRILELRAFNRGRSMEEDVHIDMPPALTYGLIAADHPDVQLDKNKLVLSRIPPRSEVSLVVLAEGPIDAESFSPTLTSKTTKGKVVKKLEEVPPNTGVVVLSIGGVLILLALMILIPQKWIEYQNKRQETERKEILGRYAFLEQSGWREFDSYVFSEVRRSYSGFEFPLVYKSARRKGDYIEIHFLATNKTAAPLKVTAYFDTEEDGVSIVGGKSVFDVFVNPMQSIPVEAGTEIPRNHPLGKLFVKLNLKFGKENLWGIRFYPSLNKAANQALRGTPASGRP